jgi:hypothetical protein
MAELDDLLAAVVVLNDAAEDVQSALAVFNTDPRVDAAEALDAAQADSVATLAAYEATL